MIPTSFFLPTDNAGVSLAPATQPLLITSNTPIELFSFALTYAQNVPSDARIILITSKDRATLTIALNSSLLTSQSSPLTSTHSILASNSITLYYVETLAQLRVLLSLLQHTKVAFLGIDNSIPLHESASEWSVQGISRTIAAMVNITSVSRGVLVLNESHESVERSVPVLNPGVGGGLSHATTLVIRVLGRWARGFWSQGRHGEGECFAEWTCDGDKRHIRWTLHDGEIDDVHIATR
jgi:hypothetical protein